MTKIRNQVIEPLTGSDTQVRARWLCQVYENDHWRDVTKISKFVITWYYCLENVPTPTQWMQHQENMDPIPAGTDPSMGGDWYSRAWTPPDEAKLVKVWITPICSLDPNNEEEKKWYWTDEGGQTDPIPSPSATAEEKARAAKPDTPTSLSASLDADDKTKVIVTCTVGATYATKVYIERMADEGGWYQLAALDKESGGSMSVRYVDSNTSAGSRYKYRVCCANEIGVCSDYTSATSYVYMRPRDPGTLGIDKTGIDDGGETGYVTLRWPSSSYGATTYIEYVKNGNFSSGDVQHVEVSTGYDSWSITGLDTAETWYFRIRHDNSTGSSAWSNVVSTILAAKPNPPEVAPLLASYLKGRSVTFSWQHSSPDGAEQSSYKIKREINGTTDYLTGTDDQFRVIELSDSLTNGSVIRLAVQTCTFGTLGDYDNAYTSDYSETVEFSVYEAPEYGVALSCPDGQVGASNPLTSLPLTVETGSSSYPEGNSPVWWRIVLKAAESYTALGPDGTEQYVAEGQSLVDWSIAFTDPDFPEGMLSIDIGPEAMTFAQGRSYYVYSELETEAGLRSTSDPVTFLVSMEGVAPYPVGYGDWDHESMSVTLHPACGYYEEVEVEYDAVTPVGTENPSEEMWYERSGSDEPYTYTLTTDTSVDSGKTYYERVEVPVSEGAEYSEGIVLSVYRMGMDGTSYLVKDGIENGPVAVCVDSHADLGTSSYRIVGTDPDTGMKGWTDITVDTPRGRACVLWDEGTQYLDGNGDPLPYMGMALFLAYNRVSVRKFGKDKSFVEHAGAEHPIVKRGNQRGDSVEVSFDIISNSGDYELLEKLEAYDGNCYVRVPGFPGFTADAAVQSAERSYEHPVKVSTSIVFTHVDNRKAAEQPVSGVTVNQES